MMLLFIVIASFQHRQFIRTLIKSIGLSLVDTRKVYVIKLEN
jgi:hypothetical protein